MRTAARFYPKKQSSEKKTGAESKEWLERQSWYSFFQAATEAAREENNQQGVKVEPEFHVDV
jgi:hypothetical protein